MGTLGRLWGCEVMGTLGEVMGMRGYRDFGVIGMGGYGVDGHLWG